jgi:multidrug efflux pump subunit AcrA (membrane-fusion protein)
MSSPSGVTRRRIWVVGLSALLGLSAFSWWLGSRAQSPNQAAAKASEPQPSWITAAVERRVLSSTVVLRGDVESDVSLAVNVPSSVEGVGVITRLPPDVGTEIAEGQVVVEVSGRPVFVLEGEVPVYRSLQPGMSGADVAQLQASLTRLGFSPEADGVFGEATKQAVAALYEAAGYVAVASATTPADLSAAEQSYREAQTAVATAETTLARATTGNSGSAVVAAQAGLNQANRAVVAATASRDEAVTNATVTLVNAQNLYSTTATDPAANQSDRDRANADVVQAQTGLAAAQREGDDAIAAAVDQVRVAQATLSEARKFNDVAAAQVAYEAAVQGRDSAALAYIALAASSGPTVAQGEVVFLPTMPARVESAATRLGPVDGTVTNEGGQFAGGDLVRLSAGALIVSTSVREGDEELVRPGAKVVLLDETTNQTYPATIIQIADAASVDSSGQVGRAALVAPNEALPTELAGVNLRVSVTAAASDGAILVVPVAAISAGADGSTRVSILNDGATEPVDVAVVVLLTADGFAGVESEVEGELVTGDLVIVGR